MSSFNELLRSTLKQATLDCAGKSCSKEELEAKRKEAVMDAAADFAQKSLYLEVGAVIQEWAETADLEGDESMADRLMAMLAGIVDDDAESDEDFDEEEVEEFNEVLEAAWTYLAQHGVNDDDIDKLLNDEDNEAAERIHDFLVSALPDGDEADADLANFAFADSENESVLDAVYKRKFVIRGGQKMRVRKRVSGRVRLSGAQKAALRKAHMKANTGIAKLHRRKSMRKRRQMGL